MHPTWSHMIFSPGTASQFGGMGLGFMVRRVLERKPTRTKLLVLIGTVLLTLFLGALFKEFYEAGYSPWLLDPLTLAPALILLSCERRFA